LRDKDALFGDMSWFFKDFFLLKNNKSSDEFYSNKNIVFHDFDLRVPLLGCNVLDKFSLLAQPEHFIWNGSKPPVDKDYSHSSLELPKHLDKVIEKIQDRPEKFNFEFLLKQKPTEELSELMDMHEGDDKDKSFEKRIIKQRLFNNLTFYLNLNHYMKLLTKSKSSEIFSFLGRHYSVYKVFGKYLSQYFVFVNSQKTEVSTHSDLFSFISRFSRHSFILDEDSHGNFVVHTFGLQLKDNGLLKKDLASISTNIESDNLAYASYSFCDYKRSDAYDYSYINYLYNFFFDHFSSLDHYKKQHNLANIFFKAYNDSFGIVYGFFKDWNITYYKEMNDFISVFKDQNFRWKADFSASFEKQQFYSSFIEFLESIFFFNEDFTKFDIWNKASMFNDNLWRIKDHVKRKDFSFSESLLNFYKFQKDWEFFNNKKYPYMLFKEQLKDPGFSPTNDDFSVSVLDNYFFSVYKGFLGEEPSSNDLLEDILFRYRDFNVRHNTMDKKQLRYLRNKDSFLLKEFNKFDAINAFKTEIGDL
jgi:hypothetical protein